MGTSNVHFKIYPKVYPKVYPQVYSIGHAKQATPTFRTPPPPQRMLSGNADLEIAQRYFKPIDCALREMQQRVVKSAQRYPNALSDAKLGAWVDNRIPDNTKALL